MELVGVRRPEAGDLAPRLGEHRRVRAVGVGDAADLGEGLVELDVRRRVRGRVEPALDDVALEVDEDDVVGLERVVGDAARLDGHDAPAPVDAADVAERQDDQPGLGQLEVGLEDGFLEFGEHGGYLLWRSLMRQQVLHDVVEVAAPGLGAEGVVELPVEGVELEVDLVARGVRLEDRPLDPAHGGLGLGERLVAAALAAGDDGPGHGRAQGAGLGRAGDLHLQAGDVGVDLHDQRVLLGDAAAVDDVADLDPVLLEAPDDGQGAEGRGLDEGPVDLLGLGVERQADEEAGQALVDEDGPVAVVPVEGEKARFAGLEGGGLAGQGGVGALLRPAGLDRR